MLGVMEFTNANQSERHQIEKAIKEKERVRLMLEKEKEEEQKTYD